MLFTQIQKAAENVPSGTGSSRTEEEDRGGGLRVYKLLFSMIRVIKLNTIKPGRNLKLHSLSSEGNTLLA